jgi:hypothetical protein
MIFDFTINIPILLSVAGGFILFGKWFAAISITLNDVKSLRDDFKTVKEDVSAHDRAIAALQAVSIGYGRHSNRQAMRERD